MQLSFFSKDFSIITLSSSTYLFLQLSNGIQTEQACKNRSSRVMTVSQSLQTLLSLIRTEESIKKNRVMRNPHMIPSSCSSMLVPWDPKDSFESKTDFCKGHLENSRYKQWYACDRKFCEKSKVALSNQKFSRISNP